MKNRFKIILSLLFVFVISGCSCVYDANKNIEDMSLIELNAYNKNLNIDNDKLKEEYEEYKELAKDLDLNVSVELINYVNEEVVKSNVMITSESKSLFHSTSVSSGSGTIIKEDSTYYYVLTNNHVIYALGNKTSYYVYDYLNNEYKGTLLFNDPNYDMAILKFKKTVNLRVAILASNDIEVGEKVIVIGQPGGQRNAITFGKVIKYDKINCSDCNPNQSNINYDCVFYAAETTNGNSGGMIITNEFQLVGVVNYGLNDNYGNYLYGGGSPVSKVREFLSNNNFEVGENYA